MAYIVDSHLHLDLLEERQSIEDSLDRARKANVAGFLTVATDIEKKQIEKLKSFCDKHKDVWRSFGIHPNYTANNPLQKCSQLLELLEKDPSKVIAIGESGLDNHYDYATKSQQKDSFIEHIKLASKTELPLIIHNREADKEIKEILLDEYAKSMFKFVLHSFSSDATFTKFALEIGGYISFSGMVTFKNAKDLQKAALEVPDNRILIETDSPYLAPVPYRGKTNEPLYVKNTLEFLAKIRSQSPDDLAKITTDNFFRLFSKA